MSSRYVLMSALDSEGQRREIFLRATSRLSELNALLASAKISASVSCDSCILRIACIAASHQQGRGSLTLAPITSEMLGIVGRA